MRRLQNGSSCVYEIYYHIVWCPKYRKPILTDEILQFLDEAIRTICDTKEWTLHELKIQPDHLHIFLSAHPKFSPTAIVKILKGVTGLRLFKAHPELKKEYWAGHIWSPSYFVGTAGTVTKDAIKKYIELNLSTKQV